MTESVDFGTLKIYDAFFEKKKEQAKRILEHPVKAQKSAKKVKTELTVHLIGKIYSVPAKQFKERPSTLDHNLKEASGLLYFVLIDTFGISWDSVKETFNVSKDTIGKYINNFQDKSKVTKSTKDKYNYVIHKVNGLEF